jgi:hypothetical protein
MSNQIYPIAFFDSPQVLDASITNIPANTSNPLQVVANLGTRASYAIDYIDGTGDFIGVYQGPVGQEVLKCIIGGGTTSRAWCVITSGSRVSLRSMTSTAITNGQLMCVFLGGGL